MGINRREAMLVGAGALVALNANASPDAGVTKVTDAPVPLPFDPKKLRNLSERMLVSHWENNYGGALKNLLKVQDELRQLKADAPPFLVGGLRERELTFSNSVVLHELYFGNLGGDGKAAGSIKAALGDFAQWEHRFRATAASLAGGSGWVQLAFDHRSRTLRTVWSGNHTQTLAFSTPLLVMDMYEHSYAMDFGAAAARYIDAFFENIDWARVDERYRVASSR